MKSIALFLALVPAVFGQSASGTFLGQVKDASGATVAAANITIVNKDTGFRRELQSSTSGEYEAPYIPLGNYTITVKAAGFRTVERSGLNLQVDQKARVDFSLAVGDVTETVSVSEAAPLVKSDSSEIGDVMQKRQVQELPLNGRNYVQLVHLQAGVTTGQQGGNIEGAGAFVPRGTGSFNAAGQRGQNNNFLVDGIDNNESWINSTILQPSVEATQEFKVYVANPPAEFGRSSGGIVNVQVRAGTNDMHGSVYNYLRNSSLDARDFFQRKTAASQRRIPAFRQNQFGATYGGAIKKNSWFIFGDYQGLRQGRGLNVVSIVPTAAQKAGDFGATNIFDPLTNLADPASPGLFTRTPFANNRIPESRIPRPSRLLTNLYPDPNSGANQYFFSPNRIQRDDAFNLRSDKVLVANKNNLFMRVSRGFNFADLPGALPRPANPGFTMGQFAGGDTGQLADAADFQLTTWGAVISDTHVFRPNLLLDTRIGFSRFDLFAVPKDMNIPSAREIGIPGVSEALPPFSGGLPAIRPTGFAFLGANTPIPSISANTNYQASGNLTWIKGRHSIKTGWQTVRRHLNFFESQDPARGFFNFNPEFTNNSRGAGGSSIASLLLGFPTAITRATLFGTFGLRGWENAWFIQDDFKVNRRLTLNLGLRHELFLPLTEVAGRLANYNFDPTNPAPSLIPALGGDKYAGRKTDNNNLAPRLGFAYQLTGQGKTVLRGSFGTHYVSVHYAGQGALGRNVPFMPIQNFAPGSLTVGRNLTDGIPVPGFAPLNTSAQVQAAALAGQVGTIQAVDRDTKFTKSLQWGMNIQHEIGQGLLLDVGYLGSRGLNLFSAYNLNQAQPGIGSVPSRRPVQALSNIANINYLGYFGASSYHGLLTKVQKNFKNGNSVTVVYTWGKSIDDSISGSSGQTNRVGGYQDINNRRAARAESTFNVPHRLVLAGVYELPFGAGRQFVNSTNRFTNGVIGGWQLNAIVTAQSGLAFTPTMAASSLNNAGAYQLPNRICNGAIDSPRVERWFDTACFAAPAALTYGNSGLNILRGPDLQQFDLAVLKNFGIPLRDGMRVQFRAEAFNLGNRANFRLPNFNIGVPAGGTITNTLTGFGRQVQMVLKFEF
ncbi:MAG: carboxypeptidase-like regulatory domain-containing protein [Bryobacteraceae bacterium]|nr:carboxypeptidase-like regulatory domain-containing protein [Bryobacteraceae bacterium]